MKLAREEQISCIVVKDFSRFGRNYLEVGNYLEQIFPLLGIRFISVDDGYDSKQNQGDVPGLDVVFKNIIHDYYSKELSVKEIQTKRNLSQKGLFLGAIPPFGYVRDPDNRFDKNAIQIVIHLRSINRKTVVGYVPRRLAAGLAAVIDAGVHIETELLQILGGYSYKENYGCLVDIKI